MPGICSQVNALKMLDTKTTLFDQSPKIYFTAGGNGENYSLNIRRMAIIIISYQHIEALNQFFLPAHHQQCHKLQHLYLRNYLLQQQLLFQS
jgi:hypothetical protein